LSTQPPIEPVKLHFIVPVWGKGFCQLFTDIALPSQLSKNNIPGISSLKSSHYHIVTTQDDSAFIQSSPAYQKLSEIIGVTTSIYDGDLSIPHDAMSDCYRIGIDAANAREAAIVFLTPDLIWSDGSFVELERIANQGHRVVHTLGLRLLKETFIPAVAREHRAADGATLTIASRDLVGFALQHLHPIAISHLWEEGGGSLVPANLYWRVDGEGLLARCFHLHPLLVNPARKNVHFQGTVDDGFVLAACPDGGSDYVVMDSDQLLACEISRQTHTVQTNLTKGVVSDIAAWADGAANQRHRELVLTPIRFHATAMTEDKWRAVEQRSGQVIDQAFTHLNTHWRVLLITRPKVLMKRTVRVAQDTVTQFKNNPDQYKFAPWAAAITTLGAYNLYVDLCRKYTVWRSLVNARLFGPASAPYPWHPLWLAHRALRPVMEPLLQDAGGSLLLVTEDDAPLTAAMDKIIRTTWSGDLVIARDAAVHNADKYDVVICMINGSLDAMNTAHEACRQVVAPAGIILLYGFSPVERSSSQESFPAGHMGTTYMTANSSDALLKIFTWRPSPVIFEIVMLVPILVCTALLSAMTNVSALILERIGRKNVASAAYISVFKCR